MTKREFMEIVIAQNINEEVTTFAQAQIEKLNKPRSLSAKDKAKIEENTAIKTEILEVLKTGAKTTAEIKEVIGYSSPKIAALCKQLVTDEKVTATDNGKSKPKTYALA